MGSSIGWTSFFGSADKEFSQSFKEELSAQLMTSFDALMDIKNFVQEKGFQLFVGMEELKTIYSDGYAFSLVELIGPNSHSLTVTAYWKAQDNRKIVKTNNIDPNNVEFGWCADLDREFVFWSAHEDSVSEINGTKIKFNYRCNYTLFPDLSVKYVFKEKLSEEEIIEINAWAKMLFKGVYLSEISFDEGEYSSIIDFHNSDFENGKSQIENFILALSNGSLGDKIKSVLIR